MEVEGNPEAAAFFKTALPDPAVLPKYKLAEARKLHAAAVYFLWSADEVVYVGQSADVGSRLTQHLKDPKKLEAVSGLSTLYELGPQARLIFEAMYTVAIRPRFNRAILLRIANGRLSEIRFPRRSGGKGKVE